MLMYFVWKACSPLWSTCGAFVGEGKSEVKGRETCYKSSALEVCQANFPPVIGTIFGYFYFYVSLGMTVSSMKDSLYTDTNREHVASNEL